MRAGQTNPQPLSKSNARAGMVPSADVTLVQANPYGAGGNHRTMAPLSESANPRVMHPKINRESWATSYAQARTQPGTAQAKGKYQGMKRQRKVQKTNRRAG
jgi:hypothetical protein